MTSHNVLSTFQKFDTSHDGALDAYELKVAIRHIAGTDFTIKECNKIISSFDANGDGVIDFDEFNEICKSIQ